MITLKKIASLDLDEKHVTIIKILVVWDAHCYENKNSLKEIVLRWAKKTYKIEYYWNCKTRFSLFQKCNPSKWSKY